MRRILILMDADKPLLARGLDRENSPRSEPRTSARTTSGALLAGKRELIIEHAGREYRLRVTAQGKLILTA
ncbi:MAG TPA: hemin uptake protein HemP [Burkholderiales bacterium]|nr:hemin uptake protein HemP [Burkholderiales bacterium]